MTTALVRALVALVVLLFSAPLLAEEPVVPPRDDAELEQRLQKILLDHKVPGMAAVIVDRGRVRWTAGLGKSNVKTGAGATPDTLFRTGSISKMFIALSALRLVTEGQLSLDASVRALAPEVKFDNPWESTDPVRVVHLLEHTTGWDDFLTIKEWAYSDPRPATLKEGLDYEPRSRTSRWRPGTIYAYTNSGPSVAAYIIEKLSGQRFEDYVAETFFKPLGMRTASFLLTPETEKRLTRLYREDGRTEVPYFHFLLRPSGSLNASAQEMSGFLSFLLDRGSAGEMRVLPAGSLDRMETPTTSLGARAGMKIGYGLHDYGEMHEDGLVWYGHNGGLEGARAVLSYLPEAGAGFFYAMNGDDDGAFREIAALLRAAVGRDVKRPELPPVGRAGAESSRYSGWYEVANTRNQWQQFVARLVGVVRVETRDDGAHSASLFRKIRGDFVPVGHGLYRRPRDPEASLALVPVSPDGQFIQLGSLTLKAIPTWLAWTELAVTALAVQLMLSAPLFALVWVPRKVFGRMKGVKHLSARVWPLAAEVALAGAVVVYQWGDEADRGRRTLWSMGFTACTVLFAGLSLGSLAGIARVPRREVNRGAYVHTWAVAVALSVVTVYLMYWGIIGFRTWA